MAVFAGWRSGKTEIGPWWLLREIQRVGPGDYAVIAPTYPLLDNKARPALRKAIIKALGKGSYHSSGNIWTITQAGAMKLWGRRLEPGEECRILFCHGTRADAIEAFDGKGIWLDEPGQMEDDIWEAVQARVSIGQHRVLFTSRPYRINWYVKEIWRRVCDAAGRRKADADPAIDCVNFKSLENPAFPKAEYERQQSLMPEWKFVMKFDGLPTKPAGAIYDCFEEKLNTCKRFPVPAHWPLYLGVDFGPINTAAVIIAAEAEPTGWAGELELTGNFYVIGTYHAGRTGKAVDHIRAIRKIIAPFIEGGNPQLPIAYGGSHTETGWRESWGLSGVPISEPTPNDIETQIQRVYAAFKTRQLKIFSDLKKILGEVEEYTYEIDDDGEVDETKIENKTKFHRLDALRYIVTMLARDSKALKLQVESISRAQVEKVDEFAWLMGS